jgi:hypothetical protein
MQKLQLFISGQRIDLFKDEQVSFNQSIQNIKDPAKIFTEFTQTFTVPASKSNNKIFEHYYNYDITDGFDARNKVDALIELNNVSYKQGYIKLEGVDLKINKPYAYRITFFGETVSLKDLIKDDKLGKLSKLSDYDLTYNSTNIKAKLQSGTDIITPLITSGASDADENVSNHSRLFYNSLTHGTNNGNLYWHTGGGTNANGVLWSDLKYAIKIRRIIEAIENEYVGIEFTDDFFNSSNSVYENLFMWLHRKKGNVQQASQVLEFPTLVNGFGLPIQFTTMLNGTSLEVYSSCNPYNSSVPCPNTSLPSVQQELQLTTTSSVGYTVVINRNGSVWATIPNLTGTQSLDEGDMGVMDEASYTVTIITTQNITFSNIEWNLSGFFSGSGWSETYQTGSFTATADFEFIIQQQIPDIKIIDFLTGLFRMFNLTAFYVSDPQDTDYGKIKVQKLDAFYAAGTSYDISEYVDTKTSNVNVALPYKQINFAYKGTGTLLAKQYEQLQGKNWGAEQFTGNSTVGNNFDAPNPRYDVVLPFEHMQMERLVDANPSSPNQTTIQYGFFVDDNFEAYYGDPLLFYPILQTSTTYPISFLDDISTGTHSKLTSYYIPSNSVSINSSVSAKNINFYLETNEYTLDSSFNETLFYENYLTYIQDIFNSKRRIIKLTAYLPLKIIYKLNMNDKLIINNQNFTINTINTNLITGKSTMELLNEL